MTYVNNLCVPTELIDKSPTSRAGQGILVDLHKNSKVIVQLEC